LWRTRSSKRTEALQTCNQAAGSSISIGEKEEGGREGKERKKKRGEKKGREGLLPLIFQHLQSMGAAPITKGGKKGGEGRRGGFVSTTSSFISEGGKKKKEKRQRKGLTASPSR